MHLSCAWHYRVTSYLRLAVSLFIALNFSCSQKIQKYEPTSSLNISTYTAPGFINIHYVQVNEKTLLFDSGNVGDGEKIEHYFEEKNLSLSEVDYLIITHGHADHAGNARYFRAKYGMKIIAGEGESEMIAAGGHDPNLCPRGFNGWFIDKTIGGRTYEPFQPDILVNGTYDLSAIGLNGRIVEVPGHTPGSIVTYLENVAFTGDLIRGKVTNQNKPDYHIFMCDLKDNLRDIETIAAEPDIAQWHLGHLGPLQVADVKRFIAQEKHQQNK